MINFGNIELYSINSSYNKASDVPGIYIHTPSSFIGEFWTITQNTANSYCIFFNYKSDSSELSHANIENNKCNYGGIVTVLNGAKINVNDCIFLKNSKILFYIQFFSYITDL